ncbi:hypothetical protein Cantr_02923 [Candida viswanathii]|uniref:Uncharacterized protein n=1 Tax=Candida viswanathii TaxID=5486 RepID=A0A367YQR3_9ASCO|nr:hypothetical protein Cantr_02923 [Candida viswanathii]
MAHPGRPRGPAQAQMANNNHHQQQQHTIKEEAGVQLHDEADLISFRNDALLRYITNHEYIENVMSKLIHSSKIIPPSLYPLIPKINDFESLKPEDIYFGDLEAMKYVENKLVEKLNSMKQESDPYFENYLFKDEKYRYQRESMAKLAELQSNLHDSESLAKLESELDEMLNEYKTKFNQEYTKKSAVSQYSISIDKISSQIEVTSAPDNYNPKLINSFINMNNSGANESQNNNMDSSNNDSGNFNNEELNGFQFNGNIDTSKFSGFNGIPMNQFDSNFGLSMNDSNNGSTNNENNENINANSSAPTQGMTSPENIATNNSESNINTNASNNDSKNSESDSSESNSGDDDDGNEDQAMEDADNGPEAGQKQESQPPQDNPNPSNTNQEDNDNDNIATTAAATTTATNNNDDPDNNSNDLDMNDFFNEKGDEDLSHLAMVDDDIGDLYNFETGGDDDNGLIGGSEFELDFLSQIDHGME